MENAPVLGMNRRKFLEASLLTFFAGMTITLMGCTDSSSDSVPVAKTGVIAGNHGHSVVITQAQWTAGTGVTLDFTGGGHAHQVTLSNTDMIDLANSIPITVTSTTGGSTGHSHSVTFS